MTNYKPSQHDFRVPLPLPASGLVVQTKVQWIIGQIVRASGCSRAEVVEALIDRALFGQANTDHAAKIFPHIDAYLRQTHDKLAEIEVGARGVGIARRDQ